MKRTEWIVSVADEGEIGVIKSAKWMQELVRCKDCVNCIKELNGELYCDVLAIGYEPLGSKKVTDDWFCADGERRDEDD